MFKSLKITCDEATTICDKNQYGEASVSEIIRLQIHFIKCKVCKLYSKQNTLLSKAFKFKSVSDKEKITSLCLSKKDKENLQKELDTAVSEIR